MGGCARCYVNFTVHGGDQGVMLFFQKNQKP
jgi:hypothetical protein